MRVVSTLFSCYCLLVLFTSSYNTLRLKFTGLLLSGSHSTFVAVLFIQGIGGKTSALPYSGKIFTSGGEN